MVVGAGLRGTPGAGARGRARVAHAVAPRGARVRGAAAVLRRGPVLVVGPGPRLGLLLQAAADRLGHRRQHRAVRRRDARGPAADAAVLPGRGVVRFPRGTAAVRRAHRAARRALLGDAAGGVVLLVGRDHRWLADPVLGARHARAGPGARHRPLARLAAARRRDRRGPAREVRDGGVRRLGRHLPRAPRAPPAREPEALGRRGARLHAPGPEPALERTTRLPDAPPHRGHREARREPDPLRFPRRVQREPVPGLRTDTDECVDRAAVGAVQAAGSVRVPR